LPPPCLQALVKRIPPRKEIPLQASAACRADRDIRAGRKRSVVTLQTWTPAGDRLGREAHIRSAYSLSSSYRRSSRQELARTDP
jgi:hypothetical protein